MRHRRSTSARHLLIWTAAFLLTLPASLRSTSRSFDASAWPAAGSTARARFQATSYTVGVWPSSATDPSLPPSSSRTYAGDLVTCALAKVRVSTGVGAPRELRWDDPADLTRDCALNVTQQFATATGTYRLAVSRTIDTRANDWSAFAVEAPQVHACDGTPATTATVVEGARTLEWCWNELDTNGNPTAATAWHVSVDGATPQQLGQVTVGPTPNAQGRKLHSASVPLTRGTRALRVAATNAQGQAVFSAAFTVTVTAPLGVPSAADIRSVR